MKRILIVEDERNFARFMELELMHQGYAITVVGSGQEGLETATRDAWDAILLDAMLPGLHGFEVCRGIRRAGFATPVIILTARDSVMDRVSGLDSGADDYLPKPFAIEELLARIRAVLRRSKRGTAEPEDALTYRDLRIDPVTRTVSKAGVPLDLTKREHELLLVLMTHRDRVLSRTMLLDLVWGYDCEVETNVVDVYVRYLRNKIDDPAQRSYIQTVRGIGYVIRS
ncbi:response regulator transcription factor [Paenibacillus oleatilyticus]|uniref:response regulator transcription factor n=1 Tax=Paenibacillus oleatilyticus TaxID=2594886 RepID=UPI001C1FD1A3|nr:response regulator transcription factor [Paenibacillus oleatilyticus]MBU7320763.1 response regulator transcription factor [Paenibacillus oleatilyticus]